MRVRSLVLVACALVVVGLASAARAQRLAELDGLPVWDEPIAGAPAPIREAWAAQARIVRDRLAPPRARSMDAFGRWPREVFASWLTRRREAIVELDRALSAIASGGGPRERLFATIVHARVVDDMVRSIDAAPMPREIERDPELRDIYRATLEGAIEGSLADVAAASRRCAREAEDAPPALRPWAAACEARAVAAEARVTTIRERAEAAQRARASATDASPHARGGGLGMGGSALSDAAPRGTVLGADRIPAACREGLVQAASPAVPPADRSAPLAIAIVDDGTGLPPGSRDRFVAALHRALSRDPAWPLVPLSELRRAERLVAQRRWRDGGPVCGQPPPLAALLAERHPNLALARVDRACTGAGAGEATGRCAIHVTPSLRHPLDRDLLPTERSADIEGGAFPTAAQWIAAAARVREGGASTGMGILGMLAPDHDGRFWSVAQVADDDPRLAVAETLRSQTERAIRACFDGPGVARFALELTVTPEGATRAARVTPDRDAVIGEPADVESVRACVEAAIAATTWPCTTSGAEERVEASVCVGRDRR